MRLTLPLALATLLAASSAQAQTVKLTLNPDAQRLASQMNLDIGQLETLLSQQLKGVFSLADTGNYLRMSANAQSLSNKGLGADYFSSIDWLVLGFSLNATVDAGDSDFEQIAQLATGNVERAVPIAAGVQFSLMAGVALTDSLLVYVNGLAYPVSAGKLSGSGFNVGAHIQYRLLSGIGTKLLAEWGGIAFTTGLEYSRSTLKLEDNFDAPVPLSDEIDLHADTTGSIELVQKAVTVPFEVTTSLRLLYFLTLYGGLGADIQLGDAALNLGVDSKLTAKGNADATYDVGNARLDFNDSADPNRVLFRVLVGAAASIGPLSAFGQINIATSDLTIGAAAGLRLAI